MVILTTSLVSFGLVEGGHYPGPNRAKTAPGWAEPVRHRGSILSDLTFGCNLRATS